MAFHENSSLMFVLQDAAANLHPFARRRQQRRARPRAPPRVLARAHLSLAKVVSERGVGEGFLSQLKILLQHGRVVEVRVRNGSCVRLLRLSCKGALGSDPRRKERARVVLLLRRMSRRRRSGMLVLVSYMQLHMRRLHPSSRESSRFLY